MGFMLHLEDLIVNGSSSAAAKSQAHSPNEYVQDMHTATLTVILALTRTSEGCSNTAVQFSS